MRFDPPLKFRPALGTHERLAHVVAERSADEAWSDVTPSVVAREVFERGLRAVEGGDASASAPVELEKPGKLRGRPGLDDAIRERIIREAHEGKRPAEIVRGLEVDGVPTARGGTWRASTILGVLARSE